jgi:ParB-like chromosome segregation protein Spo0J
MATKTETKGGQTKLERAIEFLRSDEGAGLSHVEAARRLGCSDAHIRRARAVIAAQEKADGLSEDPDDNKRLLENVVHAAEAVELIDVAIADLKDEMKELRGQRKELGQRVKDAIHAARETHPLFDRSGKIEGETEDEAEAEAEATATNGKAGAKAARLSAVG